MRVGVYVGAAELPLTHISLPAAEAMVARGEAVAMWAKRKLLGIRVHAPAWWTPKSDGMPMMGAALNRASGAKR